MKRLIFLSTLLIFALASSAQPLLIPKGIKALTYTITPTEVSYLHGVTGPIETTFLKVSDGVPGSTIYHDKETVDSLLLLKTTPAQVVSEIASESESVILKDMNAMGLAMKMIPIYSYHFLAANGVFTDGRENFVVYRVNKTFTLTGFKFITSTAGNYTPDNYNGIAISRVTGTTTTLLASTPNDTADPNMWEGAANTLRTRDLSTPIELTPGIYVIHSIYNCSGTATTAPSLFVNGVTTGAIFGQTIFPTSYKASTTPSDGVNLSTTTGGTSLYAIWGY